MEIFVSHAIYFGLPQLKYFTILIYLVLNVTTCTFGIGCSEMTMGCACKVENFFFFNGSEFLERNTIETKLWQKLNNEQK